MIKLSNLQRYNAVCLAEDYQGNPLPSIEEIVLDCCNTSINLDKIFKYVGNKINLEVDDSIKCTIIKILDKHNKKYL
jgi:hypothetical protein